MQNASMFTSMSQHERMQIVERYNNSESLQSLPSGQGRNKTRVLARLWQIGKLYDIDRR